ncbi:MAG: putative MAP kinase kinase family domain protein [Streblomastix strix]|uniref:non-specific serine/threonine protein kinase n=1 Tax=Streblomastix strix TaxID=222440 RepID=A0A5J4WNS7_9EUKA|nr:MAG: putative MAP kinase kinase family domain protein [Streblomastix strix]
MGNNQSKLYKTPEYKDFQRIRELSRGAFGRVLVVKYKEEPDVELIMKRLPYLEKKDKQVADEEIAMLQKLQAKYCVRYYGSFVYDDDICIIVEYCLNGNLRDLIESMKGWNLKDRKKKSFKVIFHTLTGLGYLHSQGIIHRNLKPENIFVDKDGTTKMGDFGLAVKMMTKSYIKAARTKDYTPPEAIESNKMTFQSDIWSLGVILVELLTGKHPYEGKTQDETMKNISSGRMAPLPADIKGEIKEMIVNMLNIDPSMRPTAQQLLETDIMQLQAEIEDEQEKVKEIEGKQQKVEVIKKEVSQPKSIWIKIRDDLLKPISGTQSQKQEIIKEQEQGCDYIIWRFEDQEDEEGRREAIKDGLIEGLNYALQNHELNSISRKYSEAFHHLTKTSDQIDLLIYQKQPFQGLLRLLEHPESLIVGDAINSIICVLMSGTDTTSIKQQHPHFTSIQQYDGIRKMFQLFNKNKDKHSKDRASICIGYLFRSQEIADSSMRVQIIKHLISLLSDADKWTKLVSKLALNQLAQNTVNRSEIVKYVDLKKIEQDLKQAVKGNEQQKQSILQQQESDIFLLYALIYEIEDDQFRLQIISSSIIDSILAIFTNRELSQITFTHSDVFLSLTHPASNEVRQQIYNENPYPALVRLLDHSDIQIVKRIITSIHNILSTGVDTTPDTQQHPHFNSFQAYGGIQQIYSLFQQNRDKDTKDTAAICIGHLFRAKEIKDKQMRKEIIGHLKTLVTDSDDWTKNAAKPRLRGLAQNAVNKADIEAGGFVIPEDDDDSDKEDED